MKASLTLVAAFLGLAGIAAEPVVSNVKMRQRYPWNGLVDIDYEVSGDIAGTSVSFLISDVQNGVNYVPSNFIAKPVLKVGQNRATWDTAAEGVNIVSTNVIAVVSLVKGGGAGRKYLVIDISEGSTADHWPTSYLSDVPAGGWSNDYKTDKIVLRRVEPGSFMMGGSVSTTISKPFYMGVFEMTQAQYSRVMGDVPLSSGDILPVVFVSYLMVRGSSQNADWPNSLGVDSGSVISQLRAKTGLDTIDLPTEAQWEYACRAGTTSEFNNGGNSENDLAQLGRYAENKSDGKGGYSDGPTVVGSYLPNALGLYDMHGNVFEMCLDWIDDEVLPGGVDPKGVTSGSYRVMRGGAWDFGLEWCTSSHRAGHNPSHGGNSFTGFRLCCAAAE